MTLRSDLVSAIQKARAAVSDCALSACRFIGDPDVSSEQALRVSSLLASAQNALRKAQKAAEPHVENQGIGR